MPDSNKKTFNLQSLFSYGFRLFFLLSLLYGAMIIPVWIAFFQGIWTYQGGFGLVDWHIHEILYGYISAVICGFLFTAIPNWTGRDPVRGMPLVLLGAIWIAGRLAMSGLIALPPIAVMVIDCLFLAVVCIMVIREIIAGKNWRNLMIVIPVAVFWLANLWFHLEVLFQGQAYYGRRLGFSVVIFLIVVIGGRIIPVFTRNWLTKQKHEKRPVEFNRFDKVCLLGTLIALASWVAAPDAVVPRAFFGIVAALHVIRASRWAGIYTLKSPLVWILHLSYGFIPLGFGVMAFGAQTAGLHVLGIGAMGGMTVAVMMRASMGHTGRALKMHPLLLAGFICVVLAMIMRSALPYAQFGAVSGMVLAACLWSLGLLLILIQIAPWLWSKKPETT
ncbi:MAG: short-chain dehydrogenase [Rhodobacteraceae bacterium]|nr:MAG: short-chain dehydrogenase [Paracoccaceae bacterium]